MTKHLNINLEKKHLEETAGYKIIIKKPSVVSKMTQQVNLIPLVLYNHDATQLTSTISCPHL